MFLVFASLLHEPCGEIDGIPKDRKLPPAATCANDASEDLSGGDSNRTMAINLFQLIEQDLAGNKSSD